MAERSSTAPDKYDLELDNAPLTQEEEEVLAKIEENYPIQQPSRASPSNSPSRKKRKRAPSASPHLTPSRLRSSVKPTARALDAGYKPNNRHSFRQESSSGIPPADSAGAGTADADRHGMGFIDKLVIFS